MSAGKGDKDRSTFTKVYKDRFPELSGNVEGFVEIKGHLIKKYDDTKIDEKNKQKFDENFDQISWNSNSRQPTQVKRNKKTFVY